MTHACWGSYILNPKQGPTKDVDSLQVMTANQGTTRQPRMGLCNVAHRAPRGKAHLGGDADGEAAATIGVGRDAHRLDQPPIEKLQRHRVQSEHAVWPR